MKQQQSLNEFLPRWHRLLLIVGAIALAGCNALPSQEAKAQPRSASTQAKSQAVNVDVAVAGLGSLAGALEYTGTTQPIQEVAVRSQTEGQLLSLNVDVGDPVIGGQAIARVDDTLPTAQVNEANSQFAALEVEVAKAQAQVSEVQARADLQRTELQQAEADAARMQKLYREGAVPQQQAEQARTKAQSAKALLRSIEAQIKTQKQAVAAAQQRVAAQQSTITQAQTRESYTDINAPTAGIVMKRATEPGNLLRLGDEILRIGDFSRVKVVFQLSELDLSRVQVGQTVQVRLDAFPEEQFLGEVIRISPAADPTARLVPVEVSIPNSNGRLGSGLLARVQIDALSRERVVIPVSALGEEGRPGAASAQKPAGVDSTLFIVSGTGQDATVTARTVTLGSRQDGKVEVLSGLNPGERFVLRSTRPLKDGDPVRLSILSET